MKNSLSSSSESLSSPEDNGGTEMRNNVGNGYEDLNILENASIPANKIVKVEIKGDYSTLHEAHLHCATSQPLLVSIVFYQRKILANLYPTSGEILCILILRVELMICVNLRHLLSTCTGSRISLTLM